MKPIHTFTTVLVLPILALTSACTTQGAHGDDHWSQRSITNSIGRNALGYDEYRDGDYIDFQAEKKKEFGVTFRRYFFHHNPENPFQAYDWTYFAPRYPHSVVPDTASYIQDPIASVIGTFSDGGAEEFGDGLTLSGDEVKTRQAARKSASYMRYSVGLGADVDNSYPR